jgi:esterase/lipase superfamily enzyme
MNEHLLEAAEELSYQLDQVIHDADEREVVRNRLAQLIRSVEIETDQPSGVSVSFLKLIEFIRSNEKLRHWMESRIGPIQEVLRKATAFSREDELAPDKAEYTVWYATNRKPNDDEGAGSVYTANRDIKTHYGTCQVYIPKSHKIGSLGSKWWKRLLTFTDDRVRLLSTSEMSEDRYWQSISAQLAAASTDKLDAVVFVHGYNVSFEDAARRAAQMGFDLSVRGAMTFFSWPSRGALTGYVSDEAAIEASESAIRDFLVDLVDRSGAKEVHIIAHSMGNRGVLRAINRIADQAHQRTQARFGQIVLAAPDVDADVFTQLCSAYTKVARRTTLYVSSKDRAVGASSWLHNYARAGLIPPVFITSGIDTVNVENTDLTVFGHGYVAEARGVLQDMYALMSFDPPPSSRFGLRSASTEKGERYWLIGR